VKTWEPLLTTIWWGIARLKSTVGMRANHSHRNPARKLLSTAVSYPSPLAPGGSGLRYDRTRCRTSAAGESKIYFLADDSLDAIQSADPWIVLHHAKPYGLLIGASKHSNPRIIDGCIRLVVPLGRGIDFPIRRHRRVGQSRRGNKMRYIILAAGTLAAVAFGGGTTSLAIRSVIGLLAATTPRGSG
jgi:hypothetical protein